MEEFRSELRALKQSMDEMNDKLEHISHQTEALDHAVRGNGKPGINEKVAVLQQKVDTNQRVVWWVIGLFTSGAVGAIAMVVKA